MSFTEKTPLLSSPRSNSLNGPSSINTDDDNDSESSVTIISPPVLDEGTTTWYASVFIVINAALGAGLLEFPYAFSQSGGVTAALVVQGVLIAFIVGSLFLLAYCSELKQSVTFPSTIKTICGKPTEIASAICIILYTYGTCVTFLIVIDDQLSQFFLFVTKDVNFCIHWYMNKNFTLTLSSLLLILPLCFSKKIDFLKYASFAGVAAVLYVIVLIIARYIAPVNPDRSNIHIKTSPDSFMDVFTVIPTVCFSYQCHVSIVPIYSCMKGRNMKNFGRTVLLAIAICMFAYSVSAVLGYYTFGDDVKEDILKSYQPPPSDVMVGVLMIAAKTYTTYPILLFCGRVEVEKLWGYIWSLTEEQASIHEFKRRCVIAIVWFTTTLLIALYVPNIAIVIDVLGALAALFIFFFPGMCLMKIAMDYVPITHVHKRRLFMAAAIMFLIIGSFLFGLVSVQSVMKDVTPSDGPAANSTALNSCVK